MGKRRYFTEERREVYLADLRRTGCHAAAARAAGITPGGARRYRRRMEDFETLCLAAEREAQARLAGAEGPEGHGAHPEFEAIRRGADGRLKIQAREAGRVRLAGRFPELEDEMAGLLYGGGYAGPGASPDRADAMVWALTELVVKAKKAEPRVVML